MDDNSMGGAILYDRAQHHFSKTLTHGLPVEQAYLHIGAYLGWMIENNLCSPYFSEEASTEIFRFRRGELSCTMLSAIWGGVLSSEFFTPEGNRFTMFYYCSGLYLSEAEQLLGRSLPSLYHAQDTRENYTRLKGCIGDRYVRWKGLCV